MDVVLVIGAAGLLVITLIIGSSIAAAVWLIAAWWKPEGWHRHVEPKAVLIQGGRRR